MCYKLLDSIFIQEIKYKYSASGINIGLVLDLYLIIWSWELHPKWEMLMRMKLCWVCTFHLFSFLSTLIQRRKQPCNYKCFPLKYFSDKKKEQKLLQSSRASSAINYSSKSCSFNFPIIWQVWTSSGLVRVLQNSLWQMRVCVCCMQPSK